MIQAINREVVLDRLHDLTSEHAANSLLDLTLNSLDEKSKKRAYENMLRDRWAYKDVKALVIKRLDLANDIKEEIKQVVTTDHSEML